jgi:hypothetical protein
MGTWEIETGSEAAQWPRLTIDGPLLHGSGELHIVGRREVLTIRDPDGTVHRLLGLADGSRSRSQLVAELRIHAPLLDGQVVDAALLELEQAGLIEDCRARGGRPPAAADRGRMILSSM